MLYEVITVSILRALAQVQLAQNDWHGAQDVTERLKKIDGNKTGINKILGQVLEGQGRFDESIAYFQSAYKASPSALSPMTSLVRAYMRGVITSYSIHYTKLYDRRGRRRSAHRARDRDCCCCRTASAPC